MKQGKILGVILSIINIILIGVCIFFYLRMDRTAPILTFQATDLTYISGMDENRLLEGITAFDSHDGDITDRIVIEKMIENEEDGVLIVFYAVCDKAGNVTKASREFGARFLPENKEELVGEIKEAGIEADLDVIAKADQDQTDENMQDTQDVEDEMLPTPSGISTPTPTAMTEPLAEPTAVPQVQRLQQEVPAAGEQATDAGQTVAEVPVFTLKVSEIRTKVGVRPALVDLIGTLSDDKDSYETLFHNIAISKYDINTAGTYQVVLTTTDSDGNASQPQNLTIVVE